MTKSALPVLVKGLTGVEQIAAYASTACALATGGSVYCWGYNNSGEVGDGTGQNAYEPFDVGISGASVVATGGSCSCAINGDATLACWGSCPDVGLTYVANYAKPTAIKGLSSVKEVSIAAYHACALTANGLLSCWGWNTAGQLGNGTTVDSDAPVTVKGL